jgi:hypothetical protein
MQKIDSVRDLERFGIVALTGESCGLMYRFLYDVTQHGKAIIEKCLGCRLDLADPWNQGEEPHVGSIMLSQEMLVPIGTFALLESGCSEVWLYKNGSLLGIEPDDSQELIERCANMAPEALARTFRYAGTAGDRNVHGFTGRVQ